ncbi:hypothetical protein HK098_002862 [Nowakowskiella sp. JEL0407]|nr:hypothetical protein HK098_002862 [Nowakowskiella sp. JEL0407]
MISSAASSDAEQHASKHELVKITGLAWRNQTDHHPTGVRGQYYTIDSLLNYKLVYRTGKISQSHVPKRLYSLTEHRTIETSSNECYEYAIVSHSWGSVRGKKASNISWPTEVMGDKELDMLTRLLLELNFEFVWVDVLCIDQSSMEDKMYETSRMCEYYSNASACLVFPKGMHSEVDVSSIQLSDFPWFGRLWTLQESWLPNQCIYVFSQFTNPILCTDYDFYWRLLNMSLAHDDAVTLGALDVLSISWAPNVGAISSQVLIRKCAHAADRISALYGLLRIWNCFAVHSAVDSLWDTMIRCSTDSERLQLIFQCLRETTELFTLGPLFEFCGSGDRVPEWMRLFQENLKSLRGFGKVSYIGCETISDNGLSRTTKLKLRSWSMGYPAVREVESEIPITSRSKAALGESDIPVHPDLTHLREINSHVPYINECNYWVASLPEISSILVPIRWCETKTSKKTIQYTVTVLEVVLVSDVSDDLTEGRVINVLEVKLTDPNCELVDGPYITILE